MVLQQVRREQKSFDNRILEPLEREGRVPRERGGERKVMGEYVVRGSKVIRDGFHSRQVG